MKAFFQNHRVSFFVFALGMLGAACVLFSPQDLKKVWQKNWLVAHITSERAKVHEKAKWAAVQCLTPHFSSLAHAVARVSDSGIPSGRGGCSVQQFEYYQKAAELFPENDVPQALLGFCLYGGGQKDEALRYYEKAARINPSFFWTYYNLGIIYFEKKDFVKSAAAFARALTITEAATGKIVKASNFYHQIWRDVPQPFAVMKRNFEAAQEDAALFLAACFMYVGHPQRAAALAQSMDGRAQRHRDIWELYEAPAGADPQKYRSVLALLSKLIENIPMEARIF